MATQMRLLLDELDRMAQEQWQRRKQLYNQIPEEGRQETVWLLAQLMARAARSTSPSKETEEPSREDP